MNSTTKFQFKSIDVDTGEVHFRDPHTHNPYDQLAPRKDLVKAWNEECRLREAELGDYHNEVHNPRDELVQETDSEAGTESN